MLRSPVLADEVAQALDSVWSEGHDTVLVLEAKDPDEAIFGFHLDGDFEKPVDVLANFDRNTVDGFDGAFLVQLGGHGTVRSGLVDAVPGLRKRGLPDCAPASEFFQALGNGRHVDIGWIEAAAIPGHDAVVLGVSWVGHGLDELFEA